MTVAELLPRVPQPPHDPRFTLLDGRVGWRVHQLQQARVRFDGVLTLEPAPGASRSLAEPSGSFGGLVPPSNVAIATDGTIYLLDAKSLRLLRFNPCCCEFEPVPCFGGEGKEPRQLHAPRGIAICGNDLYVCDTGNNRIQVFSLRGFVLRAIWKNPAAAGLPNPWTPVSIAFDHKRKAYVGDPANLGVHRFAASGKWEGFTGGLGVVQALTADCAGQIYVVVEGRPGAIVLGGGEESEVAAIASRFPALPFTVDAAGNLHLCALCQSEAPCVFDLSGAEVPDAPAETPPLFVKNGTYISRPLDSRVYRCQWHRIVLQGLIPKGTRVRISTFTAEAELPGDMILDPQIRWETNQITTKLDSGAEFDCLVMNKGGRYLWLKLELRGDGQRAPELSGIRLEYPRISLRRYLPAIFGEDPQGANFTDRFLGIFDTTLRSIESILDTQSRFFDPRSTPAEPVGGARIDFLSWLASWIGISLDRQWPEEKRRAWLREAGKLFRMRGTREGLHRQLLLLLGMPEAYGCCCEEPKLQCVPRPSNCAPPKKPSCCPGVPPLILEHFQLRRWLFLGASRIGDRAELWGRQIVNRSQLNETAQAGVTKLHTSQDPLRDPFHVYAHKFSVFVPACLARSDAARRSLVNLLESERPAHTAYQVEFVEPRFRIGFQSAIGFNSVVGRYPEGMTLAGGSGPATPLGAGTVLTRGPGGPGPALETGRQSKIGSTTMLS